MANATNSTPGSVILAGDLTGTATSPALRPTGVTAGAHWGWKYWIDAKGRILKSSSDINQNTITPLLATASDTVRGVVTTYVGADRGNFTNVSSIISAPIATSNTFGLVKVDDSTIVSSIDGTISVNIPDATTTSMGVVQIGDNVDVSSGVISIANAATNDFGVVQIGSGLEVTDGVINIAYASASQKGIIQVTEGNGLTLSSGVLAYSAPTPADATTSNKGIVQVGTDISVTGGVISIDWGAISLPNATTSSTGIVQVGNGISVSSGQISLDRTATTYATDTTAGLVKVGSSLVISDGVLNIKSVSKVDTFNQFSKAQVSALNTRNTVTGNVDIAPTTYGDTQLWNLTGNITVTNSVDALIVPGAIFNVIVKQDATGGRTITFGSNYKIGPGITLSTTANKYDMLTFVVVDSSTILVLFTPDWT